MDRNDNQFEVSIAKQMYDIAEQINDIKEDKTLCDADKSNTLAAFGKHFKALSAEARHNIVRPAMNMQFKGKYLYPGLYEYNTNNWFEGWYEYFSSLNGKDPEPTLPQEFTIPYVYMTVEQKADLDNKFRMTKIDPYKAYKAGVAKAAEKDKNNG